MQRLKKEQNAGDNAELSCSLVELSVTESSARRKVSALYHLLISTSIFLPLLAPWIFTDTLPKQWSLPADNYSPVYKLPRGRRRDSSHHGHGHPSVKAAKAHFYFLSLLNLLLFPLQLKHCFPLHFPKWFRPFLDFAPLYSSEPLSFPTAWDNNMYLVVKMWF